MLKQTLIFSCLTLSICTYADILDLGSVTRDTGTGLDWLDTTETLNLSYSDVTSEMVAGGLFEGWRYATPIEFDQLITNLGFIPTQACPANLPGYTNCDVNIVQINGVDLRDTIVEYMIRTLGDGRDASADANNEQVDFPNGKGRAEGFLSEHVLDGPNVSYVSLGVISDVEYYDRVTGLPLPDLGNQNDQVNFFNGSASKGSSTDSRGSWLVRTSVVAEDTDSDSVPDDIDNCTSVPNAGQLDSDSDGYGNACDGDFNNDCIVNFIDIAAFSNEFLGTNAIFDLNGDGAVNFLDFSSLANAFLSAPGPGLSTGLCE